MTEAKKYAGRCPYQECNHYFVAANRDQVAEHWNGHLPRPVPANIAADACLELMEFRVVKHT